jgi:hypothetical protein
VFATVGRAAGRPQQGLEQIADLNLPVALGKATDSRSKGFAAHHSALVQLKIEAIAPGTLCTLRRHQLPYQASLGRGWPSWRREATVSPSREPTVRSRREQGGLRCSM